MKKIAFVIALMLLLLSLSSCGVTTYHAMQIVETKDYICVVANDINACKIIDGDVYTVNKDLKSENVMSQIMVVLKNTGEKKIVFTKDTIIYATLSTDFGDFDSFAISYVNEDTGWSDTLATDEILNRGIFLKRNQTMYLNFIFNLPYNQITDSDKLILIVKNKAGRVQYKVDMYIVDKDVDYSIFQE